MLSSSNQKVHIEDIDYSDSDRDNNNEERIQETKFSNLFDFIKSHKLKSGDKSFTHTMLDGTNSFIFKVSDEEYSTFLDLYKVELQQNFGKMFILEKPKNIGSLCFDFDIKQQTEERQYTVDQIKHIVEIIDSVVTNYYDVEKTKNILHAYILLKKEPFHDMKNKLYKDGFHIQYPNLNLHENDRFLVYHMVKQELLNNNVLNNLSVDIQNEIDQIFDSSVIKKNSWYMYGSGKKLGNYIQYYKLEYIINKDLKFEQTKTLFNQDNIVDKLVIRNNNKQIKPRQNLDELYSQFNIIKKQKEVSEFQFITDDIANSEEIMIAKKLVKLLHKKRAVPYHDWLPVGWSLYNISPTLLNEFITFSKLAPKKYQDGCCEKVWEECEKYYMSDVNKKSGYTIASLYKWVREDNPEEYRNFLLENIQAKFESRKNSIDNCMIAKTVHELYQHEFVCSNLTKNIWWQFDNHRWKQVDKAYTLCDKIENDLRNYFMKVASDYYAKAYQMEKEEKELAVKRARDVDKIIERLGNGEYSEKIIKAAARLFYDSTFEEKLDANLFLLGFDNGVYDLSKGIFRAGCPDDYIAKTTGYDYKEFKENSQEVQQVEKFYKSIQPKDDVRTYLLCYFSSMLSGDNRDQKLVIFTGPGGSNGKSTSIDLLTHTLGNYAGTLPITLLTVKRKSSSNATPELADKKGVRFLVLNEPEEGDVINVGYMKELTGQDRIMARKLFGDPFYYTPQFKILVACNKKPQIPSDDGGTWRRLRVVDFGQRFVDNPSKLNEHPKDPELRNKLPTWKQAFMWLLINKYYKLYKDTTLDKLEPDSIKMSTEQYKEDSNVFMEFITQNIDVTKNEEDKESLDALWSSFSEWHKIAYENEKRPHKKKLTEFFKANDYMVKGTKVYGIQFKPFDSEL